MNYDVVRFLIANDLLAASAADILRFSSASHLARALLRDKEVLDAFARLMQCVSVQTRTTLFLRWGAARRCRECGVTTGCSPAVTSSGRAMRFCTACATDANGFRQLCDRRDCKRMGVRQRDIVRLCVAKRGTNGKHLMWAADVRAKRLG